MIAQIETTASTEAKKSTVVGSITLLIENPGKGKNWGPLLRCCAAFGITSIYVVGYDQCDVRGSHGASKHVQLIAFHNHKEAIQSLTNQNCELIGLVTPLPNQNNGNDDNHYDSDQDDNHCCKMIREIFFHLPTEKEVDIVRIASSIENDDVITTKTTTTLENQELLASLSLSSSNHNNDNNHNYSNKIYSLNGKSSYPIYNYCDRNRNRNHDRPHEEEIEESVGKEENDKSSNGLKLKNNNNNNNICLVVDKLKRGLPYSLGQYCDSFIHIPHHNYNLSNAIGSMLTLEASVSIIFHELISSGLYVGYKNSNNNNHHSDNNDQTNHEGQKYHVQRINKGGTDDITERRQIRLERERKIKELQEQHDDDVSFFGRIGVDNSNTNEDDEGDY